MKNKLLLIAVLGMVTLGFTACFINVGVNTIKGNGHIVNRDRATAEFSRINLEGIGTVRVHTGENHRLRVRTDSNIQTYVVTDVRNSTLYITMLNNHDYHVTELTIDVYLREIRDVSLSGAGTIEMEGLFCTDTLTVDCSGVGTCRITGSGTRLVADNSGIGKINARGFRVQTAKVTQSGVGTTSVWATDYLRADISGVGSVYYRGTPEIVSTISGLGQLKRE
jgi:hypothetical protein